MDSRPSSANARLYDIAERVLPGAGLGGYALAEDIRFVFAEGKGARLRDVDGREYIDYVGGAGALILGHSHPAVVAALQARAGRWPPSPAGRRSSTSATRGARASRATSTSTARCTVIRPRRRRRWPC